MISVKQWLSLLLFYILYLLIGAVVFLYIEFDYEMDNLKSFYKIRRKLSLTTYSIEDFETENEVLKSLEELEEHLGKDIILPRRILHEQMEEILRKNNITETDPDILSSDKASEDSERQSSLSNKTYNDFYDNEIDRNLNSFWKDRDVNDELLLEDNVWNLGNSFLFSFIALTTIGWGHMTPKTENGQIFFLVYAIIGVPLNGILFATLADIFASQFIKRVDMHRYDSNRRIILDSILYLIPGLLVFFFLPAILFMYAEDWTYINSFYFSFICLSTIGFGYFVPGHNSYWGAWTIPYRIFLFIWILFGLGYLLMILAFIQKALRSKQLRALDRKISRFMKASPASYSPDDLRQEVKKLATVLKRIDFLNKEEEKVSNLVVQERKENITSKKAKSEDRRVNEEEIGPPKVVVHRKAENSVDVFLRIAEKVLKDDEVHNQGIRPSKSEGTLASRGLGIYLGEDSVEGLDNYAYEANVEEQQHNTVTSLPERVFHRKSSIWSDEEVLPNIPDGDDELPLPDNLSIESKGTIRRRHFSFLATGCQENATQIGTLAELIDRVEEVLENEISKVEDLKNLEELKLRPRAMSVHVAHPATPRLSRHEKRGMRRPFSFSHDSIPSNMTSFQ